MREKTKLIRFQRQLVGFRRLTEHCGRPAFRFGRLLVYRCERLAFHSRRKAFHFSRKNPTVEQLLHTCQIKAHSPIPSPIEESPLAAPRACPKAFGPAARPRPGLFELLNSMKPQFRPAAPQTAAVPESARTSMCPTVSCRREFL